MTERTSITNIHVCVALLTQHKKIHQMSFSMTLLSAAAVIFFFGQRTSDMWVLLPLILLLVLGTIEIFIAIRIGFDQRLLELLSPHGDADSKIGIDKALTVLDDALIELGLISAGQPERLLSNRLQGCMTLLKQQSLLCCLQLLTIASLPLLT